MSIPISYMAPLLSVFDMPAVLGFYRDTLGLKVTGDPGLGDESGWVMLERDGVCVMLNTMFDDGEQPADAPYGMRQLYMRDPDGYNICFQWPLEGSKWSEK